jgi:hypothetical protein
MKKTRKTVSVKSLLRNPILAAAIIVFILVVAPAAFGQVGRIAGKSFPSADAAVEALIAATETYDTKALLELLGPNSRDIIQTGEVARDKEVSMEFAKLAREKKNITMNKRTSRAFLEVGDDGYPFPVPLIKQGTKWGFDTEAGRMEILARRIGRNELDAIQVSRGYVEAQHEYALTKHDGAQVNQYAQQIISSPGKQDGLAWQNADGSWGGTVGEKAAKELEKTYTGTRAPYHGYFFKILKGQGPAAPLGSLDFVVKGAMIGGFALVAYPSVYGVTGIKTFMVSHDGVVYEKDLGPDTATAAAAIEKFNPDKSWSPVDDDEDN